MVLFGACGRWASGSAPSVERSAALCLWPVRASFSPEAVGADVPQVRHRHEAGELMGTLNRRLWSSCMDLGRRVSGASLA